MKKTKVCHFTSVHPSDDPRIFLKECSSLAANGFETYLVAKGESREENGVHVIGVGEMPASRRERMTSFSRAVYRTARDLDCDIYHFHDPELMPFGLKLKKAGKTVIFDSHEDYPGLIEDKPWIRPFLRQTVASVYRLYETGAVRRLDAVVVPTPHIETLFRGRTPRTAVINNYPLLSDIRFQSTPFSDRAPQICYVGSITEDRGDSVMKAAMNGVNGRLVIAGDHETGVEGAAEYVGRLDRDGVNTLYGECVAGLCVLMPTKNYYNARPVKLFEYMAAGLPFICSDFPEWRRIAGESGAGICVDPGDVAAIRKAISRLLADRETAQTMGRAGRDYVTANCSWQNEEKTLLGLYADLEECVPGRVKRKE